MIDVRPVVQLGTGSPVPECVCRVLAAGPGDEDDDVTPIGDPPDDDEGDDWDDEDEDDEEEDDEDPLQAGAVLQRSIATGEASRHNGVRLTGR
jgi:hypothetical protein